MTRIEDVLLHLLRDLESEGVGMALIGGLAVSAYGEPRFTRDIDLAVAVASDGAAETLVRTLTGLGYRVLAVIEHETRHRLATVRLQAPAPGPSGVVIDLLFASSGIEAEIVAEAVPLEVFAGVQVPVARIGHLAALKLLATDDKTRPQDALDLRALRRVATEEELLRAGSAVHLIEERGYARGRNLKRAVAKWRNE